MAIKLKIGSVCPPSNVDTGAVPNQAKNQSAKDKLAALYTKTSLNNRATDQRNKTNWSDQNLNDYHQARTDIAKRDDKAVERGRDTTYGRAQKIAINKVIQQQEAFDKNKASDTPKPTDQYPKSGTIVDEIKGLVPNKMNMSGDVRSHLANEILEDLIRDPESPITKSASGSAILIKSDTDPSFLDEEMNGFDQDNLRLPNLHVDRNPETKFTFTLLYDPKDRRPVDQPTAGADVTATVKHNAIQPLYNAIPSEHARDMGKYQQKKVVEAMQLEESVNEALMTQKEFDKWQKDRETDRNYQKKLFIASDDYLDKVEDYFKELDNHSKFYLPMKMDWRMRFYYDVMFNNPQGVDFEMAGNMFIDAPKDMTADDLYWFKVHIANLSGKDKGDFAEYDKRVEWFDDNIGLSMDNVDQIGDKPITGNVHMAELMAGNGNKIPVAFDATTSGYQIAALLMGDYAGIGTLTNIGLEPNIKKDLYGKVVELAQQRIKKATGNEDPNITRSLFKKPSMMFIYGSGDKGIKNYIQREYLTKIVMDRAGKDLSKANIKKIASELTAKDKAGAKEASTLFKDIITNDDQFKTVSAFRKMLEKAVMSNTSGVYNWEFPGGQTITYNAFDKSAYSNVNEAKGKGTLIDFSVPKTSQNILKYPNNERSLKFGDWVKTGITANFVQSVDAYIMHYVSSRMMGANKPFLGTHDSMSTSSRFVPDMQQLYLDALHELTIRRSEWNNRNFMENAIFTITNGKTKVKLNDYDTVGLSQAQYHLS